MNVRLAVDCCVFGYAGELSLLLVRRGVAPYQGAWALPGGFVHEEEDLPAAARRELAEEAGLTDVALDQLATFGAPGRDPRGRVVSVAWIALVSPAAVRASTDAAEARWFPVHDLPPLAFDHAEIVAVARARLRRDARSTPVGFDLLPELFTLPELQHLYESLLQEPLDARNFRKKVLAMGLLAPSASTRQHGPGRPARAWRFDRARYRELAHAGLELRL